MATDDRTYEELLERESTEALWRRVIRRRSFLQGVGVGVAGAAVPAAALLPATAEAQSRFITKGDVAVLRFLAAAELIESDLWDQYAELGGAGPGTHDAYVAALQNLDGDMPQYISDNTDDEHSHAAFLNAYLTSKGADPVNLDKFRTIDGSSAKGSTGKKRLTNLEHLNVDTSWYTRYRSGENPDLGDTFTGPVTIDNHTAIPKNNTDTPPGVSVPSPPIPSGNTAARRIQAIANVAALHFAFIEQGGSSLYSTMALKVTNLEVLRIVVSIGGTEINHFAIWHDKGGNALSDPLAPLQDPDSPVMFPNLNQSPTELTQTNLIMPEPCDFLRESFPDCSVIRPAGVTAHSGAQAAIQGFKDDGLFVGQHQDFFTKVMKLAEAADDAERRS